MSKRGRPRKPESEKQSAAATSVVFSETEWFLLEAFAARTRRSKVEIFREAFVRWMHDTGLEQELGAEPSIYTIISQAYENDPEVRSFFDNARSPKSEPKP